MVCFALPKFFIMKKILLSTFCCFFSVWLSAQYIYKIKADSVLITNDSCNAELNLENSTRDTLGFLYNKGNGRTTFKRGAIKLSDSTYLIGADTIKVAGSAIGNYILNQYGSDQAASYRISGKGLIKGGFSSTSLYGTGNERMGDSALASLTSASDKNIAIGYKSLKKWNRPYGSIIAIGAHAMENLDSIIELWGEQPGMIAIGTNAMKNYKISQHGMWDDNIAIGYNALRGNDTATAPIGGYAVNVAIGAQTLGKITTGVQNVIVGSYSGTDITSGSDNIFLGPYGGISLTTGGINNGMGIFSLAGVTTGNENIGLGAQAFGEGSANRTGSIAIGHQVGRYGGGDSSIYIGNWNSWYETHNNEFILSHYFKTLLLGEFNGRKALKPQGAMVYVTETATDANYTANVTAYYIMLPAITANRTLTIPSASSNLGRQIKIYNKNSSGNSWSFASAIKKPDGTSVTTITNQSCLFLFSDGTDWIDVLAGGSGSGSGMADPGSNGIVVRTALNTTTARTITGTSNKITITDGNGVSGNPTINVGSDIVQITQSNTYTAGNKQIFSANGTNADIRLTGNSSDPSSLSAGDIWYNSTSHVFKGRFNSTTRQFATLDGTETLTNKTISAASNTLTNIGLGEVVVDIITGQTQGTSPAASDEVLMSVSGSLNRVANNKLGPTQFKNIVIESPSASENLTYFYTDKAITITKVADVLRGSSSPSVTYNIRYSTARDSGSPTNVFGSNRSVTSTSGSTTTSFTNASIPAGSWVWIITSATAGTVNEASIAITYSEN